MVSTGIFNVGLTSVDFSSFFVMWLLCAVAPGNNPIIVSVFVNYM